MAKSNDFRIGNYFFCKRYNRVFVVKEISKDCVEQDDSDYTTYINYSEISGIPLTDIILCNSGFKQLPHFTIQNLYNISIGRDRVISVACVGTPNEMVFINEEKPPEVKNIIVARNYDYDGKTFVHQLQNLYFALTGTELPIKL